VFEIEGAALGRVAANGPTLPFDRSELNGEAAVLVHFKIATDDRQLRSDVAQAIATALKPLRVNGHQIVAVITSEDVTMSSLDARLLAAHITPIVLNAIGLG
jgi:hypothetical protein